MAVPAEKPENGSEEASLPEVLDEHQRLRQHAAKLYGLGFQRAEIARALIDYLCPRHDLPEEQRLSRCRAKLKRWETQPNFRDMVYARARISLDMDHPSHLKALSKQAKRGKVDAIKFALELTGRYSPKGDQQPTQVAVVISGIPRPMRTAEQVIEYQDQDEGSIDED